MSKGKEFLSQLKLYTDYLKWDESLNRYETWNEAVEGVLNTHTMKYGDKIQPYLDEVMESYKEKEFLASQRNLQFRGKHLLKNHARMYNCCVTYAYSPDIFNKGFFVLLAGTGLGISLKNKYVSLLPPLVKRDSKEAKQHIVEDSVEGWSEACKVLISSFCSHPSLYEEYFGYQIKFDYSLVRPKGSLISGGFKAPGPEGLKQALEKIENLINSALGDKLQIPFKSILIYDIFMHLSDAVLSGGVRRSAMNIIMDQDDTDLINAKTGTWYIDNPQRARSNNSVGLLRGKFSKEEFLNLVEINQGDSDLGFVFMSHEDDMFNPCFEIQFNFYTKIKNLNESVFQFCNLNEIDALSCSNKTNNKFNEETFYKICRNASIVGTLQAGYTSFLYLGKETEEIVAGEALLGVSITGWMARPELFNKEILIKGAQIVKDTNKEVAEFLGINQAARCTTVKPSGNASVILKSPSGIHPEHSQNYFRIMQLNKDSETAKYLEIHNPEMLEESSWSATNTDYVVYCPFENPKGTLYKSEMMGVKHLELIRLVQNSWIKGGKNKELCYLPETSHNVSNTIIIDDMNEMTDYIFKHQNEFAAVSFLPQTGDKDYAQAPFTSVLTTQELVNKYGDGVIFMAGLIVDGLHYFNDNLWKATQHVQDKNMTIEGSRTQVLLKKDWIRRVKKFASNYFKKDLEKTIYCMKDVHLWHKWNQITQNISLIDYTSVLTKPSYADIDTMGSIACQGSSCEVI